MSSKRDTPVFFDANRKISGSLSNIGSVTAAACRVIDNWWPQRDWNPFLKIKQILKSMNACDIQNQNRLPFLDTSISRETDSLAASVYRKSTCKALTTTFDSFIPTRYKTNVIWALINRASRIPKEYFLLDKELNFISYSEKKMVSHYFT